MSSKKSSLPRVAPEHLGLPLCGVDAHAHLDSPAMLEALPTLLDNARRAGVAHIGHVFMELELYQRHRAQLGAYSELFFIMGFHPAENVAPTDADFDVLATILRTDASIRAVGETGFDFYWKDCPVPVQEMAFRRQLALAREADLPVVIHSRDAARETLRVLEDEGFAGRPLLWHCFSGDAIDHADRIMANGWHVSVPGPVTYPANQALRDVVARLPLERLMVETDCPYLTPNPWRGTRNEPALAAFTAEAMARARGMQPQDLWAACGTNARQFFKLIARSTCTV